MHAPTIDQIAAEPEKYGSATINDQPAIVDGGTQARLDELGLPAEDAVIPQTGGETGLGYVAPKPASEPEVVTGVDPAADTTSFTAVAEIGDGAITTITGETRDLIIELAEAASSFATLHGTPDKARELQQKRERLKELLG